MYYNTNNKLLWIHNTSDGCGVGIIGNLENWVSRVNVHTKQIMCPQIRKNQLVKLLCDVTVVLCVGKWQQGVSDSCLLLHSR